jgi:hypothetical protein
VVNLVQQQSFSVEQHQEMRLQVNEVRIAVFLERASVAAYAVCEGHSSGLVGQALDKLRDERNHWIKEAEDACSNSGQRSDLPVLEKG